MNILRAYYIVAGEILEKHGFISYVPQLKLTNAKSYYGKIHREIDGYFSSISLSKHNLDAGAWIDEEDIHDILDTISHEFAHMDFWEHDEKHSKLTRLYYDLIKCEIKLMPLVA
ncbi:MAG: hypothetical protein N4A64_11220 [Marinisporobacter sp.]|jgi:hypothetical protein|nr:hypothetical protein [Marinisporobacter sp.]